MPDPLAHVYDLALRALAEQERQVTALHGRLAPVLAAGGLGATLLAPAAFRGHRAGLISTAFLVLAVIGIAIAIAAAVRLLLAPRLAFGVNVSSARAILRSRPATDERAFYAEMTVLLEKRRAENVAVLDGLQAAFTWIVCGMLVGMCGLALKAAVA